MDFLSSIFDPQNYAGITGLLARQQPAMGFPVQPGAPLPEPIASPDGPSPLDNAQWPFGPVGAPSTAEARLPANARETAGATPAAPLALAPPAPAAPKADDGNPFSGFRDKINDNSNMLLGLAAGLVSGRSWGDGLGKGFAMAMQGGQLDNKTVSRNQTEQFLLKRGIEPAIAKSIASNPTLMRSVLPQLFGTTDRTSDIKEYEYAVKQGFKGSLTEWKAQKNNDGSGVFGTPIYGRDPTTGEVVVSVIPKSGGALQKLDANGVKVTPGVSWQDFGTYRQGFDNKTGAPVTPQVSVDNAGAEAAKAEGKAQGAARASLPTDLQTAEQTIKEIDSLLENEGLSSVVGPLDQFRPSWTMGEKGRDALARYNQLKGRSFLQAYSMLKGGGQITEVEGTKAENAMARMDRAQSEEDFKQAMLDFREAVSTGMQKLREKAGVAAPPDINSLLKKYGS